MSITESISAVNTTIRTVLALLVVGGLGYSGWYGYSAYNSKRLSAEKTANDLLAAQASLKKTQSDLDKAEEDVARQKREIEDKNLQIEQKKQQIVALEKDVELKKQEIVKLDTSLRLLKVDHRVARIAVIDQMADAETGKISTLIEFQELNESGDPIDQPRSFKIRGDVIYIDNWVVKFDDKYVEQADIERATSLVLFRRIFGEFQEPSEGFPLDEVGASPRAYSRGSVPSDLEKKIWADFWNIANDTDRAEELGIRAAHGEAVSIKVKKGKAYRVILRASDGLSIQPDGNAKTAPRKQS